MEGEACQDLFHHASVIKWNFVLQLFLSFSCLKIISSYLECAVVVVPINERLISLRCIT